MGFTGVVISKFLVGLFDNLFERKGSNPWKGIESAPKGVEFLAKTKDGFIFITEYRPADVIGSGAYGIIHSCCGHYEDMNPYKWKRLE